MTDLKDALRAALAASGKSRSGVVRAVEDAEFAQHFESLSPAQRVKEFYYDSNCGLPNERGWEVMEKSKIGPQQLYVQYSIEGVAWVNDGFGHDAGQMLYRAAAQALHKVDSRVAKVRGDFAGRVETEEDAAVLARMATRKLPPEFKGFTITAASGATWEEACEKHAAMKAAVEVAGTRAERKTRPLGVQPGWTPVAPPSWGAPTVERPVSGRVEQPAHGEITAAYAALDRDAAITQAYRDPLTGLLGHTGMGVAEQRGDAILSIDVDGLRTTDKYRSDLGDRVLERVGMVMARLQEERGYAMNAAHPHGDEFAASHPSERVLRQYAEDLKTALAQETVHYTDIETGRTFVQRGIGLSYGVGRTNDLAEAELRRDKSERAERGERDVKGETLIAAGRLFTIPATPEQLERAREARGASAPAVARGRPAVEKVLLGPGGPTISRLNPPRRNGAERAAPGLATVPRVRAAPTAARCAALEQKGIRPETLAAFEGCWLEDDGGHAVFPLETWALTPDGGRTAVATGHEITGVDVQSSTDTERRGLWDSGPARNTTRVVVVERAIDALSHHQLRPQPGTRYLATGGAGDLSPDQLRLIRESAGRGASVVAAFASTRDGEQMAKQLQAALPVPCVRETPPRGTWNDHLQQHERDFIRSQGVRESARGIERSRA